MNKIYEYKNLNENTRRNSLEKWLRQQTITLKKVNKDEDIYEYDFPNALFINGVLQDTTSMRVNANMEKRVEQILYNFTDGMLIEWTDEEIKKYFKGANND